MFLHRKMNSDVGSGWISTMMQTSGDLGNVYVFHGTI
jgi:hypothetical protein